MKSLQARFALAVRHLRKDFTYLAGISGGRDSVALLHLLQQAGFEKIVVCHFNHNLRKTADEDQKFVEKTAVLSNMKFISDKIQGVMPSSSLESGLRKARLEFFAHTAREASAEGIFLGHHADDLAETFLWNLLRGSGSAGLAGIQPETQIITSLGPIRLLRPMLDFWRSEIDAYITKHRLAYVDDESNRSRKFTRNRLRHDILPWLETKLGRNIRQNLHRTAAILSDENEWLTNQAAFDATARSLDVKDLQTQPVALQRRRILAWLQHHAVSEAGFDEVELIRSLLDLENGPARINLSANRQARRRAGKISLAQQSD